jgi:hypothetical protein
MTRTTRCCYLEVRYELFRQRWTSTIQTEEYISLLCMYVCTLYTETIWKCVMMLEQVSTLLVYGEKRRKHHLITVCAQKLKKCEERKSDGEERTLLTEPQTCHNVFVLRHTRCRTCLPTATPRRLLYASNFTLTFLSSNITLFSSSYTNFLPYLSPSPTNPGSIRWRRCQI